MSIKYGPPNIQPEYGMSLQPKYGTFESPLTVSPLNMLLFWITNPVIVIASFVIGSILYLLTHKKIFIVIPLILAFLYLVRYFIGVI